MLIGIPGLIIALLLCFAKKKSFLVDFANIGYYVTFALALLAINWIKVTGEVTNLHRQQ